MSLSRNLFIRSLMALIVAASVFSVAGAASAAEWGSIKGRFVFDGTAPAPTKLNIDKDQATCGGHDLVDQSLEVGPTGGVANVVVWIAAKTIDNKPQKVKVNPDFAKTADAKVELNNKNCHFIPHVVGLRVGQTLVIKNSDPVAHNTKIDGLTGPTVTDTLWLAKLTADTTKNPWWTLDLENVLDVHYKLTILHRKLAEFQATLSDATVRLAQAPGAFEGITITPNPASAAPGGQLQLHAQVAGAANQSVTWSAPVNADAWKG